MRGKTKSYIPNNSWIWIMLLGMGAIFLTVAIVVQLMPMDPANMTHTVNGVPQPATQQTVRSFKMIFLLAFGIVGLVLAGIGLVVGGRSINRKRLIQDLKADGVRITARLLDSEGSNIYVNGRMQGRIRCDYTDIDGTTYIFKSDLLHSDPTPHIVDDQVIVYHDRHDMGKYFVDVDESAGVGTRVVEL